MARLWDLLCIHWVQLRCRVLCDVLEVQSEESAGQDLDEDETGGQIDINDTEFPDRIKIACVQLLNSYR